MTNVKSGGTADVRKLEFLCRFFPVTAMFVHILYQAFSCFFFRQQTLMVKLKLFQTFFIAFKLNLMWNTYILLSKVNNVMKLLFLNISTPFWLNWTVKISQTYYKNRFERRINHVTSLIVITKIIMIVCLYSDMKSILSIRNNTFN